MTSKPLALSAYDAARLDKMDREADAIERHLHGESAPLLTPAERRNLKTALEELYARMAALLNQYAKAKA